VVDLVAVCGLNRVGAVALKEVVGVVNSRYKGWLIGELH
jgi:hypothetical protein